MNKELRDGLKRNIVVGLQSFKSINEVLKADYERYKIKGEGFNLATYKGNIILLDIEDSDEDISSYEFVKRQIQEINSKDGEWIWVWENQIKFTSASQHGKWISDNRRTGLKEIGCDVVNDVIKVTYIELF